MLKDLVISTSVITGECSCDFDIDSMYVHLEITDTILKLKCNNKEKSKTKEIDCKTFYNQISISLSNKANIKLFNNGKFQISGVKNINQAKENLYYVFDLIKDITGVVKVKPVFYKGMAVYKNKIIINNQGVYTCSNTIKNGKIIIKGESCDVFDYCKNTYIQDTHHDKKKNLYNSNCEEVGYVEYIMSRKSKNLCLKGSVYTEKGKDEYIITNKYKTDTGIMKVYIHGNVSDIDFAEEIDIKYNACSVLPEITDIRMANMNSNTKFIMKKDQFLDRDMICEALSKNKINFIYDPCRYAGIKFTYNDTKITIFRTGSVLFSSKEQNTGFDYVKNMFDTGDFIRCNKKEEKSRENPKTELTIWDL